MGLAGMLEVSDNDAAYKVSPLFRAIVDKLCVLDGNASLTSLFTKYVVSVNYYIKGFSALNGVELCFWLWKTILLCSRY